MSIAKVIASIERMHGDRTEQARRHAAYVAWLAGKPPVPQTGGPAPEPMPTRPSGSGRYLVPDYSKPGVADQVRKSVDEAYDAHHSIDKTRQ